MITLTYETLVVEVFYEVGTESSLARVSGPLTIAAHCHIQQDIAPGVLLFSSPVKVCLILREDPNSQ